MAIVQERGRKCDQEGNGKPRADRPQRKPGRESIDCIREDLAEKGLTASEKTWQRKD